MKSVDFPGRVFLAIVILLAAVVGAGGCNTNDPFVAGLLPELQTGITSIVAGVITGIFTALTTEQDTEGLPAKAAALAVPAT